MLICQPDAVSGSCLRGPGQVDSQHSLVEFGFQVMQLQRETAQQLCRNREVWTILGIQAPSQSR